ncbi:MAG TPA: asparagine--tRNA ligase [Planctomycetota bacterium]|nr:asparagine--tRNA ligase [Planctomycetota bacterium]
MTSTASTALDTTIRDLGAHVGARVRLKGWLYNRRSKGKIHFLLVRDGTGLVQGVATKSDVDEATFKLMDGIPQEASVVVEGTVRKDERAPGGVELTLHACQVVQRPEKDYPISIQDVGFNPDFLLERRHLWIRSKKQWATLRIRHIVEKAIHDFYDERGFTRMDAPILTPAACEGTTTLFELEYFDEGNAYLTQSGQLYGEAAAMAFGKVYVFGPVFRAERSKTRRHLTEFWMVEPEVAYATLDDVMQLAEDFICYIVNRVLEKGRAELAVLERDVSKLEAIKPPFPRMSYDEAVKFLQSKGHAFEWGGDLGAPDETVISQAHDRPVMIHRYPKGVKAFYMKRDPQDDRVALCVDVIAPEGVGEIIGGSQREDSLDVLVERINEHKLPMSAFEWYLDLRRFGSVPHGGFGLGIERTVAWICGREHVRECIPFPRMLYRIYP